MNTLPVKPAHLLPQTAVEKKWLIEELWSSEAVGIIGGEPKCGKSILALSLAVAVASGKPCLGTFRVTQPGRVLLFAAEDALHVVRSRLAAIAESCQLNLDSLKIFVITVPTLRLDVQTEFDRLSNTVEKAAPRLLLLDPFVRLHRVDENHAGEVAPLLSRLRYLQRTFHTSVILVHHARKDAGNIRGGQALRGSSEFHAWGDSNLYLQRKKNHAILLTIEHRAEKAPPQFSLELASNQLGPFHRIIKDLPPTTNTSSLSNDQKITALLAASDKPISFKDIRSASQLRAQVTSDTLRTLLAQQRIFHSSAGYSLSK